jgi:CRISPR-associated protein Csb2
MIAIRISFPTGRWHATAWGTHVNEGVVEWPPCPWRLLRALLAAWYWKDRRDDQVMSSLIKKLASELPDYLLPEATAAHTRHYMPVIEGKKETPSKIFDTFVHVAAGQSLWICWNVQLPEPEKLLLARLLDRLSYLGRAESLVEAELTEATHPELMQAAKLRPESWTKPVSRSESRDGEAIRLLAPQTSETYSEWASSENAARAAGAKAKGRKKEQSTVASDLWEALSWDTADWKNAMWSQPPGSRWIDYLRPRDCLRIAPAARPGKPVNRKPVQVARFAIIAKVPPSITQSLSMCERMHQALCKHLRGAYSPALTGLDPTGKPLEGSQHAFFLPEVDLHGYITHVTVHAPCGLSAEDRAALSRLQKVWAIEGKGAEIDIVLLATGMPEDFDPACPYFRKAKRWQSLTPFVPVRHAKSTRTGIPKIDESNGLQIGSPEHDCARLLGLTLPGALPVAVNRRAQPRVLVGTREIPCLDFQRQRRNGGGSRGDHRGFSLELQFERPTSLPYGVGYGAHFGLGLFAPID